MSDPSIIQSVTNGVYQEVANELYTHWDTVAGIAGGNITLPSDQKAKEAEFARMAKELVSGSRSITLPPNAQGEVKQLQLSEISARLNAMPNVPEETKKKLEALDDIPSEEQVSAIALAVDRGVEKGKGGFLNQIFNYIAGFLDWMMSGFSGGFQGLKDSIAERFGAQTSQGVREELELERQKPGMEKLLTEERITGITDQVMQVARDKGRGIETPAAAPGEITITLPDTPPPSGQNLSIRAMVDKGIHEQIAESFNQKDAEGKSARDRLKEGKSYLVFSVGKLTDAQVNRVQDTVADAVSDVVTKDSGFAGLSADQQKQRLTDTIRSRLSELHEKENLGHADRRIPEIMKGLEPKLTPQLMGELAQYSTLAKDGLATTISSPAPQNPVLAQVDAEKQRNAGQVTGGQEAVAPTSPPASVPQTNPVIAAQNTGQRAGAPITR